MLAITPRIDLGYRLMALGFAACLAVAMATQRCSSEVEAANYKFISDREATNALTELMRTRPGYRLNRVELGACVAIAMAARRRRARRCDGGPVARVA